MQKRIVTGLVVLICVLLHGKLVAHTSPVTHDTVVVHDTLQDSLHVTAATQDAAVPEPKESFKKKKLITAILAFPLPFGFTGMHRIYLGSDPWVPVVYLITGGGGLGLLPLIDFIYIVKADEKEFKKYENNKKVFMFVE